MSTTKKDTKPKRSSHEAANKIAKPLPKILRGYVCKQWKKCGKPNCKCTRGELHGPYYYRFGWHKGRQYKVYVRLADVEAVQLACDKHFLLQIQIRINRIRWQKIKAHVREHGAEIAELIRGTKA